MKPTLICHWPDINFAAHMMLGEQNDYYADFTAYQCWFEDGDQAKPLYNRRGSTSSPDLVESMEEAEVYVSGSIKWDGCSNIYFDHQDRVMLHFRDKKMAENVGVLLGRLYDMAAQLIPHQIFCDK